MHSKYMARYLVVILLMSCMFYSYFFPDASLKLRAHKVIPSQENENTRTGSATTSSSGQTQPRTRIALLSSYIASEMWNEDPTKELEPVLDHIINKKCYCHLWDYDYIFNQTQDLTLNHITPNQNNDSESYSASNEESSSSNNPSTIDTWWLKFGCWERIAHLEAALPSYDWILYGDIDYIIEDMTKPIESFLEEFHLYGKEDVHVVLPADNQNDLPEVFSSYALLIRNSPFGFKLLENWRQFALGICPKGNFFSDNHEYNWIHSDQPGLWYALMKTHMDFTPNSVLPPNIIQCDDDTGLIGDKDTDPTFGFRDYFVQNGVKGGNYGELLGDVPNDQRIIFGKTRMDSRSGLGVANDASNLKYHKYAFGRHQNKKQRWDDYLQRELDLCKSQHACFANFDENLKFKIGCE